MKFPDTISSSYKKPLIIAVLFSSVLLILSSLILDYGYTGLASVYGTVGLWVGVLLIVLRRPQAPTTADIAIIRVGSLPVIIMARILVRWIWHLRGVNW